MAEREIVLPVTDPPGLTVSQIVAGDLGGVFREARVWVDAPGGWRPGELPVGLVRVLAEFTYRPKWRFVLVREPMTGWPSGMGAWGLRVRAWVEDAYHPGVWGTETQTFPVPWPHGPDSQEEWVAWLRRAVIFPVEQHESDEWFKVGGVRLFDPHMKDRAGG